mgnify:FL=1
MIQVGYCILLDGVEILAFSMTQGRVEYRDSNGTLQLRLEAPKSGIYTGNDNKAYHIVPKNMKEAPTRFHTAASTPAVVTVTAEQVLVDPQFTAPSLDVVKAAVIQEIKKEAHSKLSATDWAAIRYWEAESVRIPDPVLTESFKLWVSTLEPGTNPVQGSWENGIFIERIETATEKINVDILAARKLIRARSGELELEVDSKESIEALADWEPVW